MGCKFAVRYPQIESLHLVMDDVVDFDSASVRDFVKKSSHMLSAPTSRLWIISKKLSFLWNSAH